MSFSRVPLAALLLLPLSCVAEAPTAEATKAEPTKTEAKQDDPAAEASPADRYKLSPEELALIERNPKDLGPEENRKRAHALRKKIMQDPNSEAAKALEDARQAALAGQAQIPGHEPKDNGMVIEAPEYLRTPDQTYADEPTPAKAK